MTNTTTNERKSETELLRDALARMMETSAAREVVLTSTLLEVVLNSSRTLHAIVTAPPTESVQLHEDIARDSAAELHRMSDRFDKVVNERDSAQLEVDRLTKQLSDTANRLQLTLNAYEVLQKEFAKSQSDLRTKSQQLNDAVDMLKSRDARIVELESTVRLRIAHGDELRQRLDEATRACADVTAANEKLSVRADERVAEAIARERALKERDALVAELRTELDAVRQSLTTETEVSGQRQRALKSLDAEVVGLRKQVTDLTASHSRESRYVAELQERLQVNASRLDRLASERDQLRTTLEETTRRMTGVCEERDAARELFEELRARVAVERQHVEQPSAADAVSDVTTDGEESECT